MLLILIVFLALQVNAVHETDSGLFCRYGSRIVDGIRLPNGSLESNGVMYDKNHWEVHRNRFKVCACTVRPCFPKCCPINQVMSSENNKTCVNITAGQSHNAHIYPEVYKENETVMIEENDSLAFWEHFQIKNVAGSLPQCLGFIYLIRKDELNEFKLFANGTLTWIGQSSLFGVDEFCYDSILNDSVMVPLLCEDAEETQEIHFTLYPIGMIISLPFLLMSFLVYASVPALRSLHGRSLMNHVIALFTGYLCLTIIYLEGANSDSIHLEGCVSLAFIIYFAFLASFFWLNVMCLDIWWTFSGYRPMRGSVKEREHKKFIIYSLYCWGSPLIMLIICMVMDLAPGIPDYYEKPGFGIKKCWFKSNEATFYYFFGPIGVLLICNIILFILTARKIRQVKKGTKILKKQESRRHHEEEENNAQRFNLYLKLFLVMGVNWIMEVISFLVGGDDKWWYVTDIANTLQGVLIFYIFVCKKRIRRLLKERFRPQRVTNTNSTTNSTRIVQSRSGSVMSTKASFRSNNEEHQLKSLTTANTYSDIA